MSKKYRDFLKPEQILQSKIVAWMRDHNELRHVYFFAPVNEGKRTKYESYVWYELGGRKSAPDLFILFDNGKYHGMVIEFKTENPYKQNGECKYSDQEAELMKLREAGYKAEFHWDYDVAKKEIEDYFQ